MDEITAKQIAAQLKKPHGEDGIKMGEWMNRGNVQINLDTLEILNSTSGDTILEVGMGNGFFIHHMLQKNGNITYTGADFSDVMIAEAKRINEKWIKKKQASFVLCDAVSLPFKDAGFNKIVTVNTIYFWDDAAAVLTEFKRVLQPKGKLLIALRPKRLMKNYPFTKKGFNMFTKKEAELILKLNGFNLLKSVEKKEPDFELNGKLFKMESQIIESQKIETI